MTDHVLTAHVEQQYGPHGRAVVALCDRISRSTDWEAHVLRTCHHRQVDAAWWWVYDAAAQDGSLAQCGHAARAAEAAVRAHVPVAHGWDRAVLAARTAGQAVAYGVDRLPHEVGEAALHTVRAAYWVAAVEPARGPVARAALTAGRPRPVVDHRPLRGRGLLARWVR